MAGKPVRPVNAIDQTRRMLSLVTYLRERPGARIEDVARAFGITEDNDLDAPRTRWERGLLKSAPEQERDPEGRMPLVEHLRELRNRLAKAVVAILVVMIAAAFYSEQLMQFLAEPVPKCEDLANSDGGNCAIVSFNTLTSPFTTTIKVSLMAGLIVSSPVWLYQLWAFVAPGLHKHREEVHLLLRLGRGSVVRRRRLPVVRHPPHQHQGAAQPRPGDRPTSSRSTRSSTSPSGWCWSSAWPSSFPCC
ncbi:Sec-independent protein translocase protein TatC [Streptomyces tendae]